MLGDELIANFLPSCTSNQLRILQRDCRKSDTTERFIAYSVPLLMQLP
jgi:hypothetical protein